MSKFLVGRADSGAGLFVLWEPLPSRNSQNLNTFKFSQPEGSLRGPGFVAQACAPMALLGHELQGSSAWREMRSDVVGSSGGLSLCGGRAGPKGVSGEGGEGGGASVCVCSVHH